jgi:hypothetical protein
MVRPRIHRSFWVAIGVLAAGGLAPGMAQAYPFTITTTGVISAGTDTNSVFGAGSNLAGDSYTLSIFYDGLGPSYFADGTSAFDFGDAILGSVSVTLNGHTITTEIVNNPAPSLVEDNSDIDDSTSGNGAAGDNVDASQEVGSSINDFVPFADLQTDVFYALVGGDIGSDSYSYDNASDVQTISFSGTPTSIDLAVPEPAGWAVMAVGLLGLGGAVRRRFG